MTLRLKCRDAARLLSERTDRPLARSEALRLRLHLMACRTCRRVEDQFDVLRQALRRMTADDRDG